MPIFTASWQNLTEREKANSKPFTLHSPPSFTAAWVYYHQPTSVFVVVWKRLLYYRDFWPAVACDGADFFKIQLIAIVWRLNDSPRLWLARALIETASCKKWKQSMIQAPTAALGILVVLWFFFHTDETTGWDSYKAQIYQPVRLKYEILCFPNFEKL